MRAKSKRIKDFQRREHYITTKIYSETYHDPIARETVALEYGSGRVGWIKFYLEPGEVLENSTRTGTLDRF